MFWVFALLFVLVFVGALVWYVRFAARQGHTPPARRPPDRLTSRGRKAQARRLKKKRARDSSGSYADASGYTYVHHGGHSDYTSSSESAYSSSTDYGGGYDSGGDSFGGGGDFGGGGTGGDFGGGGDSGGGGGDSGGGGGE